MSSREQLVISSPLSECLKNVQFAAMSLAHYTDMALGSGRSHMNRYEIIQLLHKKIFCLRLISDLEMALRSFKKHVFWPFEGLTGCVKCVKTAQNDRVTKADILCLLNYAVGFLWKASDTSKCVTSDRGRHSTAW